MDRTTAHLDLTIELDSEPIRGALAASGAEPQSFSGWIELVAAIEAARSGTRNAAGSNNGRGPARRATSGS